MASKVMKRGTVDQVDESQEAKVRMVTLCNVVKLVLAVWLSHPILTLPPRKSILKQDNRKRGAVDLLCRKKKLVTPFPKT